MKKIILYISTIALLLGFIFGKARAQNIQFSMDVQPELHTEVVRNLSFGTLIANSGKHNIPADNPRSGVFRIRGLKDHRILISLNMPDYLSHQSDMVNDRIPVQLMASYSSSSTPNTHSLKPVGKDPKALLLTDQNEQPDSSIWQSRFIYIYGSAIINNVKAGRYSQNLTLTVEYH